MAHFKAFGSLILIMSLILASCQPGQKDGQEGKGGEQAATEAPPLPQGERLYPSIPIDTLQMLWQRCDFIDYVFYYTDFSVSQNKQEDIRAAIRHISEGIPLIREECQPIGRIFYQVEGENRLEADLFFSEGCVYYIFYDKGQRAYANEIMPAGMQFYEQILAAARANAPQSN